MSETVVVPDSIEPYIGYKALNIRYGHAGYLLESPSQKMIWPRGRRAEARHPGFTHEWKWVLVPEDEVITESSGAPPPGFTLLTSPAQLAATGSVMVWCGQHWVPIEPTEPNPPPGMKWAWKESRHEVAKSSCGCGIYVVNNIEEVFHYFSERAVIVSVALWGTVTTASRGARAQYAYPQEIIGWSCTQRQADEIAQGYGIPIDGKRAFEKQLEHPNHPGRPAAQSAVATAEVQAAILFPAVKEHRRVIPASPWPLRLSVYASILLALSLALGFTLGPFGSITAAFVALGGWLLYIGRLTH